MAESVGAELPSETSETQSTALTQPFLEPTVVVERPWAEALPSEAATSAPPPSLGALTAVAALSTSASELEAHWAPTTQPQSQPVGDRHAAAASHAPSVDTAYLSKYSELLGDDFPRLK